MAGQRRFCQRAALLLLWRCCSGAGSCDAPLLLLLLRWPPAQLRLRVTAALWQCPARRGCHEQQSPFTGTTSSLRYIVVNQAAFECSIHMPSTMGFAQASTAVRKPPPGPSKKPQTV